MQLAKTAFLLALSLAAVSLAAGNARAQTVARAERIIADETLFSAEFAAKVQKLMPDVLSGKFGSFGLKVPQDKQPEIAAIKKKYGEADKVEEAPRGLSGPGLPEPPVDTLYTYGSLQLGVPKSSTTGKVEWLKIIAPK